jgi:hypothetical protein
LVGGSKTTVTLRPESRRLVEIGDHLAVGGVNPCALPPAASGQYPVQRSRALAPDDRDEALLLEGQQYGFGRLLRVLHEGLHGKLGDGVRKAA